MHVADELEMDRSSLYRALDPMVRERWVGIAPGIDDRSRTAVITHMGHQLLKKAGEQWEKVQSRVVGHFGRREWAAFVANVEKLRACAEAAESGTVPRPEIEVDGTNAPPNDDQAHLNA